MKPYIQLIFSGLIGGMIVLFGMNIVSNNNTNKVAYTPMATNVGYNQSPMPIMPNDFVVSAKKATSSVVHIFAEESPELAQKNRQRQRSRDPFGDFFSMDDFFGGNFYTPRNGSGSGVIYSTEGFIVTNNHVVGFADNIIVTDSEGKKYEAKKIGTDESTDLAVIKIEGAGDLNPIKLADSDKVKVGEWVLAVGNPFGYLTSTVTAGIVSAKGRSLDIIKGEKAIEEFIQTDAAINPGNSGGALVDLQGDLIGINTAIATPTGVFAGYSFAIPSNIVVRIIKDIIEKGGDIERTNLGVGGYDVDDDLIKEFGLKLKGKKGFYIDEVDKKSAVQFGGILPGDVIVEINDVVINNYEDIERTMKYNKVGDKVNIKVNRNGKEMTIPIQLRKSF